MILIIVRVAEANKNDMDINKYVYDSDHMCSSFIGGAVQFSTLKNICISIENQSRIII